MRGLLRCAKRDAAADVARLGGRFGLFVDAMADPGFDLAAPNVHTCIRLWREDAELAGDLRCLPEALPFAEDSFALVYLGLALETAGDAVGLAAACARLVEPEGTVLVLGLNPLSPARLRWMFGGLRAWSPQSVAALWSGLGLEVIGWHYMGARWSADPHTAAIDVAGGKPHGSRLSSAFLLEARRRDVGLTPLRVARERVRIGAGASAGSTRIRTSRTRVDR